MQPPYEEERDPERERVLAERARHRQGCDQERPHCCEQDDADRALVRARGVAEPGIAAPRKPEHHQDRKRLDELPPARVVVEKPRHLGDREDEHQVEEELERSDALLALGRCDAHSRSAYSRATRSGTTIAHASSTSSRISVASSDASRTQTQL